MKEEGNDFSDEILEQNLSKITDPTIDTVVIMFPYNQHNLFVPGEEDWRRILKDTKENVIIIASPNGLKKSRPDIPGSRLIITVNEMILKYWEEIRSYVEVSPNIRYIKIVSSDIDIERVKRDYNLVFSGSVLSDLVFSDIEFEISYLTAIIPGSFWKRVYQVREKLVLMLPIGLYEALGKAR
jgi:hypothetical protein